MFNEHSHPSAQPSSLAPKSRAAHSEDSSVAVGGKVPRRYLSGGGYLNGYLRILELQTSPILHCTLHQLQLQLQQQGRWSSSGGTWCPGQLWCMVQEQAPEVCCCWEAETATLVTGAWGFVPGVNTELPYCPQASHHHTPFPCSRGSGLSFGQRVKKMERMLLWLPVLAGFLGIVSLAGR